MDAFLWSLLLLILAIGLIVLEIFIPSAGLFGLLAAAALFGSLFVAFRDSWLTGVIMLVTSTVVIPAVIAAAIHWWPHTPMGKLIVLQTPESEEDVLPEGNREHLLTLIGRRGVARTKMLPSGDVVIDDQIYDALSEGMAIERGQPIRVLAVRANRIVITADEGVPQQIITAENDILARPADSLGLESLDEPAS